MLGALTGVGFAAAAGLNTFIPLVVIAVLSRFSGLIDLTPGFSWIASMPALLVFLALLAVELILDKIPGIDHINDFMLTPVRPAVGGLVCAATATAATTESASWWQHHVWIAWAIGVVVGFASHLSKAASRAAVSAATGGAGALPASFAEDALAFTFCLFALYVAWLVLPLLAIMAAAVYWIVTIGRRRRERKAEVQRRWRAEREAAEFAAGLVGWLAWPGRKILARAPTWVGGTKAKAPARTRREPRAKPPRQRDRER